MGTPYLILKTSFAVLLGSTSWPSFDISIFYPAAHSPRPRGCVRLDTLAKCMTTTTVKMERFTSLAPIAIWHECHIRREIFQHWVLGWRSTCFYVTLDAFRQEVFNNRMFKLETLDDTSPLLRFPFLNLPVFLHNYSTCCLFLVGPYEWQIEGSEWSQICVCCYLYYYDKNKKRPLYVIRITEAWLSSNWTALPSSGHVLCSQRK